MDEITLTVAKAYPNDSGRGIARLDPHTMMVLQLTPGDIIELEGKRATSAKVWRATASTGTRILYALTAL